METQLVELDLHDWNAATPNEAWIAELEAGKVLYFPRLGFELIATKGTAAAIAAAGIECATVNKVTEGRPHIVDMIKNNEIALVINTVEERRNAITDSRQIRTSALLARVTTFTTIFGAEAAVEGMGFMDELGVISVQEMHAQLAAA